MPDEHPRAGLPRPPQGCGDNALIAASTPHSALPDSQSTPLIAGLFGMHLDSLTPGKAGVELVPERHRGLAQPPAGIDLAPVHEAPEIAEADLVALELDPQALELVDVTLEAFPLDLELVLRLGQFLGERSSPPERRCSRGNREIRC